MKIERLFTRGKPAAEYREFAATDFPSGKTVPVTAPAAWSQTAIDILYGKYMRKAGVPSATKRLSGGSLPEFLQPSVPADGAEFGGETDARQVFHRIAGHWACAAYGSDTLDLEGALALYDEVRYMLEHQVMAPNSPQWFNTGLWWAYGIEGETVNWATYGRGEAEQLPRREAYKYPQTSACFINSVKDTLIGEGGILDLLKTEASIFKYGSGSGANFSPIRGRGTPLSSGGKSSGLMSFLDVFDANAGAIKSGGTTRRAAKMVVVNADHPEAGDFVDWKAREEVKVTAMAEGALALLRSDAGDDFEHRVLQTLDHGFEGEAYNTVGGQNSNNSLRVSDAFMRLALVDTGRPQHSLFRRLCQATWKSGDPGMQFDDACNKWHTVPKAGRQNATNPCSEYSFLDDSACNLASLNLVKFLDKNGEFEHHAFAHAVRLTTVVLDVTVSMSSYPTKKIAENSTDYRPLGLGYANLGGMLMAMGLPYASTEGRGVAGAVTALMHASAWLASQDLADAVGPFRDYEEHRGDVERVRRMHAGSVPGAVPEGRRDAGIWKEARLAWRGTEGRDALRNAQLTLLAPTGTIGLVMDCATTGIEPDYSLVKLKKLAGGGSMEIVNPLVARALAQLGYGPEHVRGIFEEFENTGELPGGVREEHRPVFACANDIHWKDHLLMMAAVQPFLSGAISKTVNLPNGATVDDVAECYAEAWRLGLKAVAPYRDGSKGAQPLNAKKKEEPSAPATAARQSPTREKLPNVRNAVIHKVDIGGHSVYLHAGLYPDGRLGEIFLDIGGEGSTLALFMNALARSVSIGLQHGVPLSAFVEAFMHASGEPSGLVQGSDSVRFCSSIVDYLARELDACYGGGAGQPAWVTAGDPRPHPGHNAAPGFAGEPCKSCGRYTLVRNGTCLVCQTCGETTGCS